jgi:hypothetical protein
LKPLLPDRGSGETLGRGFYAQHQDPRHQESRSKEPGPRKHPTNEDPKQRDPLKHDPIHDQTKNDPPDPKQHDPLNHDPIHDQTKNDPTKQPDPTHNVQGKSEKYDESKTATGGSKH